MSRIHPGLLAVGAEDTRTLVEEHASFLARSDRVHEFNLVIDNCESEGCVGASIRRDLEAEWEAGSLATKVIVLRQGDVPGLGDVRLVPSTARLEPHGCT